MSRFLGSADGHYKSLKGKKVLITGMVLELYTRLANSEVNLHHVARHTWRNTCSLTGSTHCTSAGGSAGIGKATAIGFSDNGAIVTITGRRQARLDAVTSQLKQVALSPTLSLGAPSLDAAHCANKGRPAALMRACEEERLLICHLPWLQGYSIVADLMDVSEAKRTIDEAVEKMGGLDILVSSPQAPSPPHICPFRACPADRWL